MRCKRLAMLGVLIVTGCFKPLQTDSRFVIDGPVTATVTAAFESRSNQPLVEMPVEGQGKYQGPTVAIIDVDGLLFNENMTGPMSAGENPVDLFRERLDTAAADPRVCAVVVRINSPGGGVTASDIMWRELLKFRERTNKPAVACIMDLGTGGAYYLATACDLIVGHPTSITGGIGVLLNLYNLEDFLQTFNLNNQSIKAGANIDLGSIFEGLKAENRRLLQDMADEYHQRFQKIISRMRPEVRVKEETLVDGRVFTARQALERKLIDRIGYLDDALAAARELAHQPEAYAVLYHRCNDVARTPYATTPNVPLQAGLLPISVPGVERPRLPTFLYLWQPDPSLLRLTGK